MKPTQSAIYYLWYAYSCYNYYLSPDVFPPHSRRSGMHGISHCRQCYITSILNSHIHTLLEGEEPKLDKFVLHIKGFILLRQFPSCVSFITKPCCNHHVRWRCSSDLHYWYITITPTHTIIQGADLYQSCSRYKDLNLTVW